jgi:hypothetical protein
MRLIHFIAPACILLSTTAALPSRLAFLHPKDSQTFIGPMTRDQRLAEGWIDEDAKYFRKCTMRLTALPENANCDSKQTNLGNYINSFFGIK